MKFGTVNIKIMERPKSSGGGICIVVERDGLQLDIQADNVFVHIDELTHKSSKDWFSISGGQTND